MKSIKLINLLFIALILFSGCEKGYDKPFYYPLFGKVTFNDNEVEVQDKWSFETLKNDYAKDKIRAYFRGSVIDGSDGESFRVLGNGYAVDKNLVYIAGSKRNSATYYTTKNSWIHQFKVEDTDKFVVLDNYFAKCSSHVYYGFGNILKNAHSASFESLGQGYARDKNYGFYISNRIKNSMGKSFHLIDYPYAADDNSVFIDSTLVQGAQPKLFKVLKSGIAKDSKNVYNDAKLIAGIDGASFHFINNSEFAKDKNRIYYNTDILEGADRSTFYAKCGSIYAYDKNRYYSFYGAICPDAYSDAVEDYKNDSLAHNLPEALTVNKTIDDFLDKYGTSSIPIEANFLMHSTLQDYTGGLTDKELENLNLNKINGFNKEQAHYFMGKYKVGCNTGLLICQYSDNETTTWLVIYDASYKFTDYLKVFYDNSEGMFSVESVIKEDNRIKVTSNEMEHAESSNYRIQKSSGKIIKR